MLPGRLIALKPDAPGLPLDLERPVVAIGNFDGVHRGHQVVLRRTRALADALERPAAMLTFEPHPSSYFRPVPGLFRLTDAEAKADAAAASGMDATLVLPFGPGLAAMDAAAFLDDLLGWRLSVSGIVAGHDFHFGRDRAGTPETLKEWGQRTRRPVEIVAPFGEGEPISSTAVRAALGRGEVEEAARLLGRPWTVRALVRHGAKRGRDLGFPTANLALDPACGLRHGIYAVRAKVEGEVFEGVASFGRRPTFDDGAPLLEVYLLDFRGDLYGRTMEVAFMAWLRPEERFADVEALIVQMHRDVAEARRRLAETAPALRRA